MPVSLPRWAPSGACFTTARKWLKGGLASAALLGGAVLVSHFVADVSVVDRPVTAEPAPKPVSAAARLALEQCVKDAFLLYDVHWSAACMVVAEQDEAKHAACLNDPAVMANPHLGKDYCDRIFPPRDDSIDCDLPGARAASVNAFLRDAQQKCQADAGTP